MQILQKSFEIHEIMTFWNFLTFPSKSVFPTFPHFGEPPGPDVYRSNCFLLLLEAQNRKNVKIKIPINPFEDGEIT